MNCTSGRGKINEKERSRLRERGKKAKEVLLALHSTFSRGAAFIYLSLTATIAAPTTTKYKPRRAKERKEIEKAQEGNTKNKRTHYPL